MLGTIPNGNHEADATKAPQLFKKQRPSCRTILLNRHLNCHERLCGDEKGRNGRQRWDRVQMARDSSIMHPLAGATEGRGRPKQHITIRCNSAYFE